MKKNVSGVKETNRVRRQKAPREDNFPDALEGRIAEGELQYDGVHERV